MNWSVDFVHVPHDGISPLATVYPGTTIGADVTIFPGAVVGRPPKIAGSVTHVPYVGRDTVISDGAVIGANAVIYAGVFIGEQALIGDGATIRENCIVGQKSIVGNNCTFQNDVFMGARSRVVDLSHITAGVFIGDNVFISTNVLTMNDNSMNHGGKLEAPQFASGSMVGGGAIILPGVDIGEGALVAAGSVVTKSVEAGQRVQGIPAKPYWKHEPKLRDDRDLWLDYYFDYEDRSR